MRKLFLSILLLALFLGSHLVYLYTHREFTPSDFKGHFVGNFSVAAPDEITTQALAQTYAYLGHGKQMTAFESADHRYVIKFVNPRAVIKEKAFHSIKGLKRLCSMKWVSDAYFKRKQRLQKLFYRYHEAFQELKDEAGLVYVHLDRSPSQKLRLIDKEGKAHEIDLVDYPFVLQKKATVVTQYLKNASEEVRRACGKQLYDLFLSRAQKGYTDRIQTLHNNYGFVDGQAIQIDLGRIWKDEAVKQAPEKEVERIISQLPADLQPLF